MECLSLWQICSKFWCMQRWWDEQGCPNLCYIIVVVAYVYKVIPRLNSLSATSIRRIGNGGMAPPFLTLALDGDDWSTSRSGRFSPTEVAPATNCMEDCMESVWTLQRREKFLAPTGNRTPTPRSSRPLLSRYTGSGVPAPDLSLLKKMVQGWRWRQ
jgi:hypothetical protein